jgi:hypothetical protein
MLGPLESELKDTKAIKHVSSMHAAWVATYASEPVRHAAVYSSSARLAQLPGMSS